MIAAGAIEKKGNSMSNRTIFAAALSLAVSAGPAIAGSCNDFKPSFWAGKWDNGREVTLEIKSVDGCSADVTYSWGPYKGGPAGSYSTHAASGDGVLIVPLAFEELRATLVVTPKGGKLKAMWQRADGSGTIRTKLTRQ